MSIIVKVDESLEELMPKFFKYVREDLEQMKNSISSKDAEGVRRMGHKIKGSSNGYGLVDFAKKAEAMEGLSKESNWESMESVFKEMIDYLDNVKIEYVEEED